MAVLLPTPGEEPWDAKLNAAITGIDTDLQNTKAAATAHAAAADPHTGYQKESEKGVASGYASLDGTGKVPTAQLPAGATVDEGLSGSWFSGKKWTALGTSITIENTYTYRIRDLSGMTLTNLGVGGATLCSVGGGTGPGGNGTIYTKMLTTATSAEVITMETINDWRYSLTLGAITDASNHALSYYGALKEACEWILTNRPAARFFMFTAYPDAHPGTIYPNGKGMWHWEYNDAMRRVGNLYGVPVINVGEEAGINRQTSQFFTTDLIHMNANGGMRYGDYAWSRMRFMGWHGSRPTAPGGVVTVNVTGVTLSVGPTTSLAVGATLQLSVTIAPTNATNKGVTWASSNPAVATTSMDGLITGVTSGTTTITVTTADGGFTDTTVVTVATVPASGVTVSPSSWSGTPTETTALTATVAPTNAGNKSVTWSSSNTGVATVNGSGVVTAVTAGSATITATTVDGGFTSTCTVSVVGAVAVTSVDLLPATLAIAVGATSQLTATVLPANAANKSVTYASNNTGVATVNGTGLVTGVAAGTATITVTTVDGGKTDTTVVTASISEWVLQDATVYTGMGLTGLSTDVNGDPTWTGVVAGWTPVVFFNDVAAGHNAVEFTCKGTPGLNAWLVVGTNKTTKYAAIGTVTSVIASEAVGVSTGLPTTAAGTYTLNTLIGSLTAGTKVRMARFGNWFHFWKWDGSTWVKHVKVDLANEALRFKASDADSISFAALGLSVGAGSTTVTDVLTGTWTGVDSPPTGVSVSPATFTVGTGATQQLVATVAPGGASQAVTWASSAPAVATVNASGLVTGVAAGTATITATTATGGFTSTSVATVQSGAVTGVTVTPPSASVGVGKTQQLTAVVAPAYAANKTVAWASSAPAVASVDSSGLVTGLTTGSTSVSATTQEGGFSAASAITGVAEWTMRPTTVFRGSNLTGLTTDGNGDPTYTNVGNAGFGVIWFSEEGDNACEFEVPPGTPNVKGAWVSLGSATDITTTTSVGVTFNTAGNLRGLLVGTGYTGAGAMVPDANGWIPATWLAGTVVRIGRSGDRVKIVEIDKATGNILRTVWDASMATNFAGHETKYEKVIFGIWAKGVPSSTYMMPIKCKTGLWVP